MSLTDHRARLPEHVRGDAGPLSAGGRDEPRREIWVGGAIASAFFILFLGWAAFVPLDAGAYAQGSVVVSGNRQAVQHRDGGVVSDLLVREGDRVRQGQVLLRIAATELLAQERALTSQVISLKAQRARLIAERDGTALIPPAEFATYSPEDRVIADEALRLQQLKLSAARQALSSERAVLQQRVGQLSQQINGYDRQFEANAEQQRLIGDELDGMRRLEAQGYAPKTRVRALERSAADLQGQSGALRAESARAREAIGEARMQMVALDRRAVDELVTQLQQTEAQLGDLAPRLQAAREQLARTEVRAPATGAVVGLTAHTVGGVVAPGQTLMEVVPTRADLVVEARVSPNDADDLRVGQETEVRFPAFHENDMPILKGRITKLSADSFTDQNTGISFFKAEVAVPETELARIRRVRGADQGLRPGLPVEVVVPLRKRTALDYLFEPLNQTFWRSFLEQ